MGEPSFGRQVRERRRTLDLTQDELARRVGCAAITIRKIEAGAMRASQLVAERLAVSLGVPPDERPAFVRAARRVVPDGRELGTPSPPRLALHEIGAEYMAGQVVRGYQLGEQIGSGGFGAVYRAIQPLVERDVAIKIILPQYADQPDFIRRFEAEAQLVARLEHPHIVPLYDYWREPGVAYLVMRLLRGGSLDQLLQQGALPLELVLHMVEQLGSALHAAHAAGVVHRDLKPANVLLDKEGNAYLADFGIAKDLHRSAALSMTGAFVGSPAYSSPEQIRAEPITPQTDIYAFGVLLYEMLTGQRPFPGPTPASFLEQHLSANVPPLETGRRGLPPALDRTIRRATAKIPTARFNDVAELVAEVRVALGILVPVPFTVPPAPALAAPPTVVLDLPDIDNPYRGLRLFNESDAASFFGRESLVQLLLTRLGEGGELARFLAVVGPSGSGKSSVVRAGLVPALRSGGLPGSEQWYVADLLPGPQPLEALIAALCRVAPAGVEPDDLRTLLRADERGLLRAARAVLPPDPATELLLLIDQFEELFTLTDDETAREHVLDSIVTAVLDERSRLRIVITLRADFIDQPLQYVDFGELIRQRSELVLPLTAEETERAILGPARRVGLYLEEGLVAALMADGGGQPGTLPLLQHALRELYMRRQGRRLSRAAYAEIGGVMGGLASSAEACYTALGAAGEGLARQLFLRLTTPGEGTEDTRRRTPLGEIHALGERADAVVRAFGNARLLTFDRDSLSRAPTVEVAHEALLRAWPRLRGWLDGARADLRIQRRMAQSATEWEQAARADGYLARGAWLTQYEALGAGGAVTLTADERAYLAVSLAERDQQAAAERERQAHELEQAHALAEEQRGRADEQSHAAAQLRRRAIWLAGALALALVAALAAGIFANRNAMLASQNASIAATAQVAGDRAVAERNMAERQAREARARAWSAAALANLEIDPERSILLSLQAISETYTVDKIVLPEAENTLHRAVLTTHLQRTLSGHTGVVFTLALSPDGTHIATSGPEDKTIRLWDVASGKELLTLNDANFAEVMAFSRDGKRLFTGSLDPVTNVWDLTTGKVLLTLPAHFVGLNQDGTQVLLAGSGSEPDKSHIVTFWDVATEQPMRTVRIPVPDGQVVVRKPNPDLSRMALVLTDGSVKIYDLATGNELFALSGHKGPVNDVTFSPDETRIATAAADQTAKIWDAATGKELLTLAGHSSDVWGVAFSPYGARVATAGRDGRVKLWDAATGKQLLSLSGHTKDVERVAFSPDGSHLVTVSDDHTAKIWDITPGRELLTFSTTDGVGNIAISPDESRILTCGCGGATPTLWDLRTGKPLFALVGHTGEAWGVAYSPDGTHIATAGSDKTAKVWDAQTGKLLLTLQGHQGTLWSVAFSPDSRRLATTSEDKTVKVWDAVTGKELLILSGHTTAVNAVAFSPEGQRIASGGRYQGGPLDAVVRVWDATTGKQVLSLSGHTGSIFGIAFSPDGKRIATASKDGTAKIWDAASGKELFTLANHTAEVDNLAFRPDGTQLATASIDGTAKVWDVATGRELQTLPGPAAGVQSVAFSRDGARLIIGAGDSTVRVYLLRLEDLVGLARTRLTRSWTSQECTLYLQTETCPPTP